MMKFNEQNRSCHPERSEGPHYLSRQTLRCAQGDITLPILMGKPHHQRIFLYLRLRRRNT
jgi:hypothetical protein